MASIEVPDTALTRLRIHHSALWETLCALVMLIRNRDQPPFPYRAWADSARPALQARPVAGFARWVARWPDMQVPEFFLIPPAQRRPDLASELNMLRSTPSHVVRRSLGTRPEWSDDAVFERFRKEPAGSVRWAAVALEAFWQAALAPRWPRMVSTVDEDVLPRARVLVVDGADAMLNNLHDRIQWERPWLQVNTYPDDHRKLTVSELTLVPLLFARGSAIVSRDDGGLRAVSYQARGAAVLASRGHRADANAPLGDARLAALIGTSRAALIRSMSDPITTTALANLLGLAPSTVSQHLAALDSAGLVTRYRAGLRVFYQLSDRGRRWLAVMDD